MMKVAEIFLNTSANDAHRLLICKQSTWIHAIYLWMTNIHAKGFTSKQKKKIPMY